jgi:hypothetical protein
MWAASSCVSLVSGNLTTNRSGNLQPLLPVAWMVPAPGVGRIKGPDYPLLSPDSGTHCNALFYTERVNESNFGHFGDVGAGAH